MSDTEYPSSEHNGDAPKKRPPLPVNRIGYDADTGRVFQIWFLNGLFRILTLGIYTFWGKTRMRRYLASGFSLDGDRFEYTGTGKELFLGFLKAIPIYLVALGPFIAVNIWVGDEESLKALWILPAYLPLIYFFPFAYFAARRYRLSRTTWRGIRFALTGSAFRYANYAMLRIFLNTITLGILKPFSEAYLHRHVVDRMVFGNLSSKLHVKAFNFRKLVSIQLITLAVFVLYPLSAVWIAFSFGANESGLDDISFSVEQESSVLIDEERGIFGDLRIEGEVEDMSQPDGPQSFPEDTSDADLEEIDADIALSEAELDALEASIDESFGFVWAIFLSFLFIIPVWIVLKMHYAAEMLRGKINGMVVGHIRFKCHATATKIFMLHLGNGFIHIFTFGWGACFIIQRRMRFLKNNIVIGGDLGSDEVRQAALQQAGIGEGIDDIFDFDTGFIGGGII